MTYYPSDHCADCDKRTKASTLVWKHGRLLPICRPCKAKRKAAARKQLTDQEMYWQIRQLNFRFLKSHGL